ncbi:hypothetical protein ACFL6S_27255 [Candidatus Poribacteria bacterium]
MIWESRIWKEELQKELDGFTKLLDEFDYDESDDWDNYVHYNLQMEKFFFVCAFIVRKLMESYKLSDELEAQKIHCVRHKRIEDDDTFVDFINYHHIDRFYDLDKSEEYELELREICNYFIHSFVLLPNDDTDGVFHGVFVNSDWIKEKYLYYVEFRVFVNMLEGVIEDDIASMMWDRRNSNGSPRKNPIIYKSRYHRSRNGKMSGGSDREEKL